ncbi:MAG: thermonuclease family protein, partial [Alphaproteobacteria bacterium]
MRGVAAPERDDTDDPAAPAFLRQRVEGQDVSCLPDGTKTRGRIVAVCFRDGQDIGQLIIQTGYA